MLPSVIHSEYLKKKPDAHAEIHTRIKTYLRVDLCG